MVWYSKCTPNSVTWNKECTWKRSSLNVSYVKIWLTEGKTDQCQMYITNWHRRMGQSIFHCMWLRRHARFVWTRTQMIILCSPHPAALSAASDSAPYCFNWASKPGNDKSLQPALVSYMLCLHTQPFSLSALLVPDKIHRKTHFGWICWSSVASSSKITDFSKGLCFRRFNWSSWDDGHEELEQRVSPQRGDRVLPP